MKFSQIAGCLVGIKNGHIVYAVRWFSPPDEGRWYARGWNSGNVAKAMAADRRP